MTPPSPTTARVPGHGRVLGIDLGSRRIGVAISDADQRVATGLTVVARSGDLGADHQALAAVAAHEEAVGIVVGFPASLDGSFGPAAQGVRQEVEALRRVVDVPVDVVDERFTTVTAARGLDARRSASPGRSGRAVRSRRIARSQRARGVVDQAAAAVILQSWLDRRRAR